MAGGFAKDGAVQEQIDATSMVKAWRTARNAMLQFLPHGARQFRACAFASNASLSRTRKQQSSAPTTGAEAKTASYDEPATMNKRSC
jgi:hypothetical protein